MAFKAIIWQLESYKHFNSSKNFKNHKKLYFYFLKYHGAGSNYRQLMELLTREQI